MQHGDEEGDLIGGNIKRTEIEDAVSDADHSSLTEIGNEEGDLIAHSRQHRRRNRF